MANCCFLRKVLKVAGFWSGRGRNSLGIVEQFGLFDVLCVFCRVEDEYRTGF